MSDLTTDEPLITPADWAQAKVIAEALERMYPGHHWGVYANVVGGIAVVNLAYTDLAPDNRPRGFTIHLKDLASDPSSAIIRRAGGEMLERWSLARSRATDDSYHRARAAGLYKGDA